MYCQFATIHSAAFVSPGFIPGDELMRPALPRRSCLVQRAIQTTALHERFLPAEEFGNNLRPRPFPPGHSPFRGGQVSKTHARLKFRAVRIGDGRSDVAHAMFPSICVGHVPPDLIPLDGNSGLVPVFPLSPSRSRNLQGLIKELQLFTHY
jgi:hypothetical protein